METSTPNNSPAKKRLPNRASLIAFEDNAEDLQTELQNRRLEAINKSTENKRRSVAPPLLTGLNATQLAQHCKDCIKLSVENKINSKNAFCFLLIDAMAAMTKKSDSEMSQNFQVATCTLDASVKIYGYRVDAVHTEAMKIATGFLAKAEEEALEDGEQSAAELGGEGKLVEKVKTKKRRRKNTIVAPNALNSKTESEALLDGAPKHNVLSKAADQLLKRVPKYNDSCLLMVDADVPCLPYDKPQQVLQYEVGELNAVDELKSLFEEISIAEDDKLCTEASAIEYRKIEDETVNSECELSQTSAFEFDVNATVEHVSDYEPMDDDLPAPRLTMPCTGYDSSEEIAVPLRAKRRVTANIKEMKERLSVRNLEYSMFDDKILKAWAGPTYWKVRPSRHLLEENKENEEGSHAVAAVKRTRRGKVKEVVGIFDVSEDVIMKHLEPSSKTKLASSTLTNWKTAVITLADDYQYKSRDLFSLFHLPMLKASPKFNKSMGDVLDDDDDNDYENSRLSLTDELEYCSQSHVEQADDVVNEDPSERSTSEVEAWDAENMVSAPNKVNKIPVGSFQRKKHIDIKHLKKCIWNILSTPDAESDNSSNAVTFCELLNICPVEMPISIAEGLNAPLMFNALLHLTNEKCLVLKQEKKGDDFVIRS